MVGGQTLQGVSPKKNSLLAFFGGRLFFLFIGKATEFPSCGHLDWELPNWGIAGTQAQAIPGTDPKADFHDLKLFGADPIDLKALRRGSVSCINTMEWFLLCAVALIQVLSLL